MIYSNNDLLKKCLLHKLENWKDTWIKIINKYLQEIDTNLHGLRNLTNQKLKELVRSKDTQEWRDEVHAKDSLTLYRQYKCTERDIKEVDFYENDEATRILTLCRSNSYFKTKL